MIGNQQVQSRVAVLLGHTTAELKRIASEVEVERILLEICTITPRSYAVVKDAFTTHVGKRPYAALDLARICHAQALADAPMPWEPGYEQSMLEDMFADKLHDKLDLMDLLANIRRLSDSV